MAYNGKTNWQLNEIVKPEDMNRIEQGVIDAHENLLTHKTDTNSHTDIRNKFNEFVKGVTGSNATLTITKGNDTTSTVTVNNVANATNATKAMQDSTGQQINSTYIKGLSVSGKTITYTKGNNTTGTITTQDTVYTHPNSGVSAGTYKSVTVNAQGHVTAGSNPTTLSGYGITDASLKGHTHDDRYYTESEINTKLSGKSNVGHTHSNYAVQGSPNNLIDARNEFTFVPSGYSGAIFFNYKTVGGKNGDIKEYVFGNGKGGILGTAIHSSNIGSQSVKYATSAANSATATKATQDSAGQQINTTYIKGLSISGNTITYTKGNGGTGSITVPTGAGAGAYIVEKAVNSDGSWYRKWSDGWLEQGGIVKRENIGSYTGNITSFVKPFSSTSTIYSFHIVGFITEGPNVADDEGAIYYREYYPQKMTNTSFFLFPTRNLLNYTVRYYAAGK